MLGREKGGYQDLGEGSSRLDRNVPGDKLEARM